jgi:hypothetical protein
LYGGFPNADQPPMDDLAQYSPLRRAKRRFDDQEPFRFQTPIVFRLAPVVPLSCTGRERRPRDPLRRWG